MNDIFINCLELQDTQTKAAIVPPAMKWLINDYCESLSPVADFSKLFLSIPLCSAKGCLLMLLLQSSYHG